MFNKKKQLIQEQERTIMELNEQLQSLQLEMDNVKSQLEAYKQRELSISRALTDAAETASRIVTDAQRESDDIHDSAQKEYITSQKKGEAIIQSAYENARDIIKEAEKTGEQKINETNAAVGSYVQLLNQFNDAMKEQARQAEDNLKRIAAYYTRLNNVLPELFAEVPKLSEPLNKQEEPLPDPEGDPAQLMRNIYDIPDRTSVPEEGETVSEAKPVLEEEQEPLVEKPVPQFDEEEGEVVKVSDIVSDDVGTIDTEELIAQTTALGDHSQE